MIRIYPNFLELGNNKFKYQYDAGGELLCVIRYNYDNDSACSILSFTDEIRSYYISQWRSCSYSLLFPIKASKLSLNSILKLRLKLWSVRQRIYKRLLNNTCVHKDIHNSILKFL